MRTARRCSGWTQVIVTWLLLFAAGYWFFSDWQARRDNPNTAAVLEAQSGGVILKRNWAGHFVAEGAINGHPVKFLIDTGATRVAVPRRLADKLGLKQGTTVLLDTANGTTTGYQTRLHRVRVGAIELGNVSALITEGLQGDTVLLGMSFLKQVELTQRGDQLIMKPLTAGV